jgi:3',5'-cyclic AMP phosphodiesterase CpdA
MMKRYYSVAILILVLAFQGCNGEKESEDSGFSFAFLTDFHMKYEKNADQAMELLVNHVNERSPDFVIAGGDLISDALAETEESSREQFGLYLEKAKGFRMPLYNTIGNHEEFGIYERSGVSRDHPLYGHKMYESIIGERFYSFGHKGWKFYILDSVEETEDRRYYGNIDSVQIDWIKADLLQTDKETPIVVVSHIPFITAISQYRGGSLKANSRGLVVENAKEILDLFEEYNLKMVLQGHLHILEEVYIDDIRFITGGAVCGRWWNGANGKTEEGYLMVEIKGEDIKWEYMDYGWEVEPEAEAAQ